MMIKSVNLNEPVVVILGAGASRGASFVRNLRGTLPPLDGDFFTQLQRMSAAKPRRLIDDVLGDVVGVFGNDFRLTMEQYLTHIEQLTNVFDDYKSVGRPPNNPYRSMRENFIQALAAVLDESIGHDPECAYHESLVKSLNSSDTLMSFNYDWLLDHTLRTYGRGKWNPLTAYGVQVYRDEGAEFWAARKANGDPVYSNSTIELLKMHGSMNWFPVSSQRKTLRVRLRQRWWHQQGNLRFEIAPPEWNKPIRSGIYRFVWRRARRALRRTEALAFIGYSLPETDLPARALFMVDSREGRAKALRWLILVNPDRDARRRVRRTLVGRINERTRVLTFDYFEEFHRLIQQQA